ncbi:MAG: homocysteine S-methyltransferase family protein [Phycisphaerae bacterium]|jgi:methionine synthase I (cobalamin-dependent)
MKFDGAALLDTVSVADGAWATQLRARGLPVGEAAESANLSHPEMVVELGREYLAAGARWLTTNTFGANRLALEARQRTADVTELNRRGAELARQAAQDEPSALVVGTIGPCARILAVGEVREDELRSAYEQQATALAAGGVDALLLETFSELAEILAVLRVVKEVTNLPVIASMSFDSGPQRTSTMMGAHAEDCAAALDDAGADVVGCNCGGGVNTVLPAVVALRAATQLPLWVKPSAGLPDVEDGQPVYTQTPEQFTAIVPTLIDAGANIIGGCCGTGPEHIRRLASIVATRQRTKKRRPAK